MTANIQLELEDFLIRSCVNLCLSQDASGNHTTQCEKHATGNNYSL